MVTWAKSRKTRRLRTPLLLSLCLLNLFFSFSSVATELTLGDTPTQVCFSPNMGCTEAIVRELDGAKKKVTTSHSKSHRSSYEQCIPPVHHRSNSVSPISWFMGNTQRSSQIFRSRLSVLDAPASFPPFPKSPTNPSESSSVFSYWLCFISESKDSEYSPTPEQSCFEALGNLEVNTRHPMVTPAIQVEKPA